ncbi:formate-dependent phosphoribosylglycinamide formyltransferase [Aquella oligotrophica]|uniref:Formate-dependent phosphoribosylglycinamide formyltransferase n=1 Tax=Aquella oligotrophica TaxID=2067065 RepID=A0A2I7N8D7_9NEIS|nr:formate-dependent phosphoribosylglycinamide formyltransferase [Aquella oligotrophica]AUR52495.1 phosphoribosylglycinamide formyltransferase 2 [Aquella oligotrophica]
MQLGTALTKSAFKVMFLGGGELGKEVVIALQRLGVEVIVVDRYANAPAMQVAHRSHVIAMTDAAALRELIINEKPNLVVPEIEAIATEVLLEIEDSHLATVIPTARAVNLTMNRAGIRTLASEELQLPTSNYRFAKSLDELKVATTEIGFPCFIKPVMSSSGKGQSMISSASEVEAAWEYANQAGRVNKCEVIVEAKIDFDFEITLLTVRAKNAAGKVETHFCNPIGHRQVAGDYVESWQPQPMSENALAKAQQIAKTITDNLGGLGIFGVELFVSGDEVWFSEVSPRPHDTGMVTMITQYQNEFELHARAILGLPVNPKQKEIGASHVIYAGVDKDALSYANLEQALAVPDSDLRLFAKPEGFIKRRMGVALSFAESIEIARSRAKEVANAVKVIAE